MRWFQRRRTLAERMADTVSDTADRTREVAAQAADAVADATQDALAQLRQLGGRVSLPRIPRRAPRKPAGPKKPAEPKRRSGVVIRVPRGTRVRIVRGAP